MSPRNAEHKPVPSRPESVLDPGWEALLRAGQAEDGGAGSVEAELAIVHLLRHARAVEPLAPEARDQLWQTQIAPRISPTPWWRRSWLWGALPVAATAALLIVVLRGPPGGGDDLEQASDRAAPLIAAAMSAPSTADALERQFAQLEGDARRELGGRVERGRGLMRAQLLASASQGDAP